jgi:serine/threonine protein kinase
MKVYDKRYILNTPSRQSAVDKEIDHYQMFDHPNIVKLYNHLETDDAKVLFMEFVNGQNLKEYIYDRNKEGMFLPEE